MSCRESKQEERPKNNTVGARCYALYHGRKRNKQPWWVPAVVTKVFGTRTISVCIVPKEITWRRHIDQLHPCYGLNEDSDAGEDPQPTTLDTQVSSSSPATTDHSQDACTCRRNQHNGPFTRYRRYHGLHSYTFTPRITLLHVHQIHQKVQTAFLEVNKEGHQVETLDYPHQTRNMGLIIPDAPRAFSPGSTMPEIASSYSQLAVTCYGHMGHMVN